ncbi:MAG TPA: Nif11-like leader peptide family natural product precursor [Polyangiaceae bacterium]|jgi:predicted ribosomally synthesized peptide with nif11-like leader|nr:Nif11-like leader peptide family natural product precursor [Polyangiaceae bacterium]
MSQEKVAQFVKAVAEKKDLNQKVAAAEKSTSAWVQLGKQAGFEFSKDDLVGFVKQVTGSPVTEKDAIATLIGQGEMNDTQLDAVSGGAGFAQLSFSPQILTRIGGAFNIGGINASFVKTSGPEFVKSGGSQFGGGGIV